MCGRGVHICESEVYHYIYLILKVTINSYNSVENVKVDVWHKAGINNVSIDRIFNISTTYLNVRMIKIQNVMT